MVKCLLALKANPNLKTNQGCTALFTAAYGGEVGIVEFLATLGCDVNVRVLNGSAP